MSPKIVDREKRSQQIALAALELFADGGIEQTSMAEIALVAGIGKGTIYEYFESKEALVYAALRFWIDEIESQAELPMADLDDPVAMLYSYAHGAMDAFYQDEKGIKIFLSILQLIGNASTHEVLGQLLTKMADRPKKAITAVLLEGVSRGIFRPGVAAEVDRIAVNTLAYLDGIGIYYFINKEMVQIDALIDYYLDTLVSYLKVRE